MLAATPDRLFLPDVSLCAVTSVNVAATVRALEACLAQVDVATCLFFTDAPVPATHPAIRVVPIAPLQSASAYSEFLLESLVEHVETSHCLVVQWDGHIIDASQWDPAFLDYDYVGASWPQFGDGHDVGNGGFSLRSRRLMAACRLPDFHRLHPEDVAIGRVNRPWLEKQGLRFAPRALADRFSAERAGDPRASFGFHGVWHMPQVLGNRAFGTIYTMLDDRGTVRHDMLALLRQVARGPGGYGRAWRLMVDYLLDAVR